MRAGVLPSPCEVRVLPVADRMRSFIVSGVVFGVGVLLAVASLLKVPIGYGPGLSVCFPGLALFGLSFVPRARAVEDAPPPMSFPAKLAGIFFEPSGVFRNLRAHPRWLFALVL